MTLMTTRRMFHALALAGLAATGALPTRAAVIQSAPVQAVFAADLAFVPTSPSNGLVFDTSLGMLDAVTLRFDGIVSFRLGALLTDPAPYPSTVTAEVSAFYSVGPRIETVLAPITAAATVTPASEQRPYPSISASGSSAQTFDLAIPASRYGAAAVYTDFGFGDLGLLTPSTTTDATFRGVVTALFDYTPAGGGTVLAANTAQDVPEPASFAVLGFGLAGLAVIRRRAG